MHAGMATWLASGTSADLITAVTNETGTGSLVFGTAPTIGGLVNSAGSATAASWPSQASGTLLTTAEVGAEEFDGAAFYKTIDTTSGRQFAPNYSLFRLTGNGSALGPAIADAFGANSSFPYVANGVYELNYYVWFLKTTSDTTTWTLTNTASYTNLVVHQHISAAAGLATEAAPHGMGLGTSAGYTTAAAALPVSATISTTVRIFTHIRALVECANAAGDIRLRVTSANGTVTLLRGSYYTAMRLPTGNVGTFAA
jgi:hypothetical protein